MTFYPSRWDDDDERTESFFELSLILFEISTFLSLWLATGVKVDGWINPDSTEPAMKTNLNVKLFFLSFS